MDIKLELLKGYIFDYIDSHIKDFGIEVNRITDTVAIALLAEIKTIICDDKLTDFEAIEEIVSLFEENGINCGVRHDF